MSIKIKARDAVRYALKKGRLKRQRCAQCLSSKTQAHHPDYTKPLQVIWLCVRCHATEHAILKRIAEGRSGNALAWKPEWETPIILAPAITLTQVQKDAWKLTTTVLGLYEAGHSLRQAIVLVDNQR